MEERIKGILISIPAKTPEELKELSDNIKVADIPVHFKEQLFAKIKSVSEPIATDALVIHSELTAGELSG